METVNVKSSKNYDVLIGSGSLSDAGKIIRERVGGEKVCIVTDDTVERLYADRLRAVLQDAGYTVDRFVIPHGEASKNASEFLRLLNFLASLQYTRTDTVAALGGGVVGDLAGFAAACYMRGMKFVQLPTTLLAAVDSSVGGKTAIDLDAGKNLAGAFYQPEVVICDPDTLLTLSDEIYADGCAEIIKYAVIADPVLFEQLRMPVKQQAVQIIKRCVEIKRDVVAEDEFDNGKRFILNFGHTVGHAIEAESRFALSHGKAVAIGMCVETLAAEARGFCSSGCAEAVRQMVRAHGLPDACPYDVQTITKRAFSDKKRRGDKIGIVVPTGIGECRIERLALSELQDFIEAGIQ